MHSKNSHSNTYQHSNLIERFEQTNQYFNLSENKTLVSKNSHSNMYQHSNLNEDFQRPLSKRSYQSSSKIHHPKLNEESQNFQRPVSKRSNQSSSKFHHPKLNEEIQNPFEIELNQIEMSTPKKGDNLDKQISKSRIIKSLLDFCDEPEKPKDHTPEWERVWTQTPKLSFYEQQLISSQFNVIFKKWKFQQAVINKLREKVETLENELSKSDSKNLKLKKMIDMVSEL